MALEGSSEAVSGGTEEAYGGDAEPLRAMRGYTCACRRDKDKVENHPCVASVFVGFPFGFFLSSFFWYFPLPTFLFFYISIFILFSV